MKVLDRFIVKELMIPIIYVSCTLVFLILIADLFDNLDQLLRYKTPPDIYIRYYLCLIPYAFVQTIHWSVWLATIYLLVSLGAHNEILAMKSAGLKIAVIMRPILFLGFLIGIFTFIVQDKVVPSTYKLATHLRAIYIDKSKDAWEGKILKNLTYHAGKEHLYYFRTFAPSKGEGSGVIILWLNKKTGKTYQKISAAKSYWKDGLWELEGAIEHQIDSRGRILGEPRSFNKKEYADLTTPPTDLINASQDSIFLSYKDMKNAIQKLSETGVSVHPEKVDLHYRLASPWQSMVMMLMAIPFLARTNSRKGIAASVLICVGMAFGYHVFGAIGLALGKSAKVLPFLSAWLGNIAFSVVSLLNLEKGNY